MFVSFALNAMNGFLSASRKIVSVAVLTAVLGLMFGVIIVIGYWLYIYGEPIKVLELTNGKAGTFLIGETKESLLMRLPDEAFSPQPKPVECPANWIEVKTMTSIQKECLLSTDEWEVGSGIKELCPMGTDFFATLVFSGHKVERIKIRCTRPE